jgi:hypothetical protein
MAIGGGGMGASEGRDGVEVGRGGPSMRPAAAKLNGSPKAETVVSVS